MGDSYSSVTHRSLGDNLIDSIKGIVVGVILFLLSFPVLWWNEGRLDISTVAKHAVVVKDSAASDGEGKLVAVTAPLKVEGQIGDPEHLKPGAHAMLRREVEMFAWVETVKTETKKKLGGGSDEIKTYSYEKKWTSSVRSTDDFAHPEGHENPALTVERRTFYAAQATVGGFGFSPEEIELPAPTPIVDLSADKVIGKGRVTGRYLYQGAGTLDSPKLGDVRIFFSAVEPGRISTLYGQRSGATVVAYLHEGKDKLYRVLPGTHEEAIATLHGEHTTMTWILRLVGFLMMWFGLALVLGPVNAILDIIPFIGSAGRALAGIMLFPIALGLSGVTILVSIVAHNPILLVLTIAGFIGGTFYLIKRKRDQKAAAGALAKAA